MDKLTKETLADIIGNNMRDAAKAEIERDDAISQIRMYRQALEDMVSYCRKCDGKGFISIYHRDEGISYHYEKVPCNICTEYRLLLDKK